MSLRLSRVAACCYLVVIAGGIFSALFVREAPFVPRDAAATARAIAANDALWRAGIAVHLLYLLPGAVFNVILYQLLRPAGPTLALIALVLGLADVAIECGLLTLLYVPLMVAGEAPGLPALEPAQRDAVAYLTIRAFFKGWSFALVLFSGFCMGVGALIVRTHVLPRAIGALMILAGVAYLVSGITGILSPALLNRLLPWILIPSFVGELSLASWLATKGVAATERPA